MLLLQFTGSASTKSFTKRKKMETLNFPSITSSRTCDLCKAGARIFCCHDHSAYFCILCDQSIHSHTIDSVGLQPHDRLWVCNSCEKAPAELICRADAAFLCKGCDEEIHSANLLARRHVRVPVCSVPCLASFDEQVDPLFEFGGSGFLGSEACEEVNEDETDSWFCLDQDFPDENLCTEYLPKEHSDYYWDKVTSLNETKQQQDELVKDAFINNNLSSQQTVRDSVAAFPPLVPYCVMTPMISREAKILRYREKKKARKYAKKVRYASRKAYAESRPRVKGRFASKPNIQPELDQMFAMHKYGCSLF